MFKNILKTTVRSFLKNGFFSFINVLGLAIGLATCILIFLFVMDDLSFDKHFEDAGNIYRIESRYVGDGEDSHWAATQGGLITNLMKLYPEISEGVKINFVYNTILAQYEDKSFTEDDVIAADTTFLDFFNLKVLKGIKEDALKGPEKVVLNQSTALKYFGDSEPIGKVLKLNGINFKVTAVVEDLPYNTHFHFDMAYSLDQFRSRGAPIDEPGGPSAFYNYAKFKDKETCVQFEKKANENVWISLGYVVAGDTSDVPEGYQAYIIAQPICDIHLNGHAEKEIEANGDMQYIYIFSIVALFILIIACINYMNLTTAKSVRRCKEVGIRKVLGAQKSSIFKQFMGESYLISLLSVLISLILVALFLPAFNQLTGKHLELNVFSNLPLAIALVAIYLLVGFLAGSYPAIFLSRYRPLKVLKANIISESGNKSALYFRRGLVILQFTISVILIVGAFTVYRQLVFIQDKKLGFKKDNVVVIKLSGINDQDKIEVTKKELLQDPNISAVSASGVVPGMRVPFLTVRLPDADQTDQPGGDEEDGVIGMRVMLADLDVVKTFGLNIVDGRAMSEKFGTDKEEAFLLNQAAVREFNLENPVGTNFEYLYGLPEPKKGKIVGVVEDFHYASLHNEVEPIMIHYLQPYFRFLSVKINTDDVKTVIDRIEDEWAVAFPGKPFDYFFLDAHYDNLYKSENNLKTIVTFFTALAILIACLGLFGLAAYITEQRTKEIGIRKVLGASSGRIIFSLSVEFMILVLVANILACVPAWFFLSNWLDGFAFGISIDFLLFVFTAFVSLFIAFVTVGSQAWKAAAINPAQALKWE
jgi:putative ABC transport system permease protein